MLHKRIATAHGIAYHHAIRRGLKVLRMITLHQLDTRGLQLGAHGWIDIRVGPGNTVPELPGQQGDTTHKGAADAENMNVSFQQALLEFKPAW